MVDVLMPFLRPIKSIVLRIEWRSDILIQELKQPIMLISGEDEVSVQQRKEKNSEVKKGRQEGCFCNACN